MAVPIRTLALGVLGSLASLAQSAPPILAQQPAISATTIVFSFAGDLWRVPRSGGNAIRLTNGPGIESNPYFSPDGTRILFTGEYDGNTDIFVVGVAGGIPQRLTWHPAADLAAGWSPDGNRVLFQSTRTAFSRAAQLFTTDLKGSYPVALPLPMGYEGAYSPDGSRLAYVPIRRAFQAWKQYRGGTTTPIWIANLADSAVEKVPRENSNDICPMWVGGKVYFLSDRKGAMTLFSFDTRSKQVKQEIENRGLDYKHASAGPDAIVLARFGAIELFDLKSGKVAPVAIRVDADLPEVREQNLNVSRRLTNPGISPTGARALFEANGEILTVPAEKGDVRNLTQTPGAVERSPAWAPNGQTIAYLSDAGGEYEIHLKPQSGIGEAKRIALPEAGFYRALNWSPDSRRLSLLDSRMRIWMVEVESGKVTAVGKERYWNPSNSYSPQWSPDSQWLAYSRRLDNYLGAVFLYSVASGETTQVTDGMSDATSPVFDSGGKYLYFLNSTDSGPSRQPDVGSSSRTATASVYAAVLSGQDPSPFAPESDEEKVAESSSKPDAPKPEGPKPDAAKPAAAKPAAPSVKVDLDGLGQRILAMPLPPRRYAALRTGKAGTVFAVEMTASLPGSPAGWTVHRYTMSSRKADVVATGVTAFEVSHNGEKMLARQGMNWAIRSVPPPPPAGNAPGLPATPPVPGAGQLATANLEVRHAPREAWKQMYREAWRIQRDHFYDPGYHGLDLGRAERLYEPYLAAVGSRSDLNYLFAEMMGNLVVGHLNVGGGEMPEPKRVPAGLLGCDYVLENGRYRFARVFNGENWNPDAQAPLTQPGVQVRAGDYLLAINNRDLTAADNVDQYLEGLAGKQTRLRVGPDPSGTGAREVTVVPVPSEARLRNLAWIEDNRRKVSQMTNGEIAYVYLPDTSFGGNTNFNRYFYSQVGKQGAIIDERFNAGGQLATDVIEQLSRKRLSGVASRDGGDEIQPQGAIFGPKVMLINEFAGSGGDAMPWYFRRAGVGKLIGKRTWGGLVGRAFAPPLMDGGVISSPSSAVWDPAESQWIAENVGVSPDIEIELDPKAWRQGRDLQLERAIETVMAERKANPAAPLKRPPYPKYQTLPPADSQR